MNATTQQTEPNTHEMVVIHRIYRDRGRVGRRGKAWA
jgi:hypothetical protein